MSESISNFDIQSESVSISSLRSTTADQLREHAIDSGPDQSLADRVNATEALCNWFVVLRSDDRYPKSALLRKTANTVRRRLIRTSSRIDASNRRQSSNRSEGFSAAPTIDDQADQLIELIETIVQPDFWQSNGGVGSASYFESRRALVVRATTDIHQDIMDLLTALR